MCAFDDAFSPFENNYIPRLVDISLCADRSSAFRDFFAAIDTFVVRVVSWDASFRAVATELRRLFNFTVTDVYILRIVKLFQFAIVAAAFLEVTCFCTMFRSEAAYAVCVVDVSLLNIEIASRALGRGSIGDVRFDPECFDLLVYLPSG